MTDEAVREHSWRSALRNKIINTGIRVACGQSVSFDANAAAGVPLVSAGIRLGWVRLLGSLGLRSFVARSGLGYDFVCHVGDLSEHPFYYRRACENELAICAAWLHDENRPIVYDVGANVGFFATHLAQMLAPRSPHILAFEPVPLTFVKLVETVQRLGLGERVKPIAAAVSDKHDTLCLAYSERNSPYAQVAIAQPHVRVGSDSALAVALTLDDFCTATALVPSLIKIDVEGSEPAVLRGATNLLSRPEPPALLLEHNPTTLAEFGADAGEVQQLLAGFSLFYVDDIEGQRRPFGSAIASLSEIEWICNVFAVPKSPQSRSRWEGALKRASETIAPPPA
ncbi:MAG: hypothetical protein QOD74_1419 [Variibacter sp.]|nr:hypothetical protein [Variibacter sp.]